MLISYCDLNKTFHQLQLPPGGGIFGYDPSNFVVLDEMGISSMHMRLTADGDRLFVEDLQSLNGTMIKGRLISEKTEHLPKLTRGGRDEENKYGFFI